MPSLASVGSLVRLLCRRRWGELGATLARGTFPAAVFRWNVFYVFRLVGNVAASRRDRPHLEVRWGGPEDGDALQGIRPRAEGYGDNFTRGHRLVIGEVEGVPVACAWLELQAVHVSRPNAYSFEVPARAAWLYGSEIAPSFRGRGLFRKLHRGIMNLLAELGRDTLYSAVERDNTVALRANRAIGARALWEYRVFRFLGTTWHDARPLLPGVGRRHRGFGHWSGSDAAGRAIEWRDQLPVTR